MRERELNTTLRNGGGGAAWRASVLVRKVSGTGTSRSLIGP
jgi:hypothetical protein